MKIKMIRSFAYAFMALATASLFSCLSDDEETIVLEAPSTGIPSDEQATPNPSVSSPTTYVPNIQTTIDYVNGILIIRIDMTGVKNPDGTEWLRLYGTGSEDQNIWLEVDDIPKGIDVYNNADKQEGKIIPTDIVFTVDNSLSMDDEADAVARDIVSWAQLLVNSKLDARFGVVGYGGFISGAIDLTTVTELSEFLDYRTGTGRTMHFGGSSENSIKSYAKNFPRISNYVNDYECGTMAIRFAHQYFTFRSSANRIYVNFTDEPNQPNGKGDYSVDFFSDQNNWAASYGTVHTVFSADRNISGLSKNYREKPWLISEYTGGTTIFAPSNFSGVTLESLPVTGAMENSYIIRFSNAQGLLDGKQHKVHITIRSKDGSVIADKVFYIIFKEK